VPSEPPRVSLVCCRRRRLRIEESRALLPISPGHYWTEETTTCEVSLYGTSIESRIPIRYTPASERKGKVTQAAAGFRYFSGWNLPPST
jgi:hypothetical protein